MTWTPADGNSRHMRPGESCGQSACHDTGATLVFAISGTVYPTGHEPDDCSGFDDVAANNSLTVVVTDANGAQLTLYPNNSGNFYYSANFVGAPGVPPLKAKVVANGKERVMAAAVDTGDCDSCHTQSGVNGAPGRITVPF